MLRSGTKSTAVSNLDRASPLLRVQQLKKHFAANKGTFGRPAEYVRAVDGIDFDLMAGETLGLVGESGCGKSTLSRLLMGLIQPTSGNLFIEGHKFGPTGLRDKEHRRRVQMVFQDSYSSLNPKLSTEQSVAFAPMVHGMPRRKALARAHELLAAVGLEPRQFGPRFPNALSGGQRQRVNIARALALHPEVVILDEPVSALDKSVEAQVLNLLIDLKRQFGLTYLFISHDLNVVRYMSDRVMVMYLGRIVETGPVDRIFDAPSHPYTAALLASHPTMQPGYRREVPPLTGDPPNPINPPSGCRFRTRCAFAEGVCSESDPKLYPSEAEHSAACLMLVPGSGHSRTGLDLVAQMAHESVPINAALDPETTVGALVHARDLRVTFVSRGRQVHAVNGVDLDVSPGEVVCLLGESGSGKSALLRSIMRLNPQTTRTTGVIEVCGRNLLSASETELRRLRGGLVSMIFQEPMTALDPVFTIGAQIRETIMRHENVDRSYADHRALELLERVQVPSSRRRLDAYPHELSGGLRQRAMIAIALSCRPKLLLADEPTTALDATVQIQILLILREMQKELGMGMIFVTHDLGVAGEIADRVAVMYAGRVVEEGPTAALMSAPLHPYAEGLLGATAHGHARGVPLITIPGSPPALDYIGVGCAFAPRCVRANENCLSADPTVARPQPGRSARCIHLRN